MRRRRCRSCLVSEVELDDASDFIVVDMDRRYNNTALGLFLSLFLVIIDEDRHPSFVRNLIDAFSKWNLPFLCKAVRTEEKVIPFDEIVRIISRQKLFFLFTYYIV